MPYAGTGGEHGKLGLDHRLRSVAAEGEGAQERERLRLVQPGRELLVQQPVGVLQQKGRQFDSGTGLAL